MIVRRAKADSGFTLLEVLVAVAILALSLTSLLGSQIESMQATRYARQISAAAFLAEYQLIEIRNLLTTRDEEKRRSTGSPMRNPHEFHVLSAIL